LAAELTAQIADFFYLEADLLDERRFREWLDLLDAELTYQVPIRRNVARHLLADKENTRAGKDALWFDEDKVTLTKRVLQLETGEHWAEEPVSRVSHLVTNVRVLGGELPLVKTSCRVLVYRNRVDTETDILVARRHDTLRMTDAGPRIVHRQVLLEQSVLQPKNLTFFL
jgi:3-phenylpropionate/cinnamic acid dioxygenase small subunit